MHIIVPNQNIFLAFPFLYLFRELLYRKIEQGTEAERLMPDRINNVYFQIIPFKEPNNNRQRAKQNFRYTGKSHKTFSPIQTIFPFPLIRH